jgi:16S rRNA (cytosine1402-N4)-methyltransferase
MNATMSLENTKHLPVMLDQVLSIISPQHGGTFVDCTFGGGGYSKAILKYPNTKVLAIDRDETTKNLAHELTKQFPERFDFFVNKFSNLSQIISLNLNPKAIIFDLGLSSIQLSDDQRGFSFKSKGLLSMQMGINNYSAYDIVNFLDKKNLANVIKIFGEEKDGKIIASKITKYRTENLIKTSEQLSSIIKDAKRNYKNHKKNPATKTFQAIRILVNQELSELILGLIAAAELLKNGGILVVVSFHSLEDKIVKYFFNTYSNLKKNPSRYLPINKNKPSLFSIISKKPLTPNKEEILKNNRARSAKLRHGTRNSNIFYDDQELQKKFENYLGMEAIRL